MPAKKPDVNQRASCIHDYGFDLETNLIYLMGEESYISAAHATDTTEPGVEFSMANRFIKNLDLLTTKNPDKPITIKMKTCGGLWEEGMAIYDAIRACKVPVTIISYTHARSMSSLIFQAADTRIMMPNSYFMFHDGTIEIGGTVKQVESGVEFSKKAAVVMLDIYTESMRRSGIFAGKPRQEIRDYLRDQMDRKEDVYLTALETVDYGLADSILDVG